MIKRLAIYQYQPLAKYRWSRKAERQQDLKTLAVDRRSAFSGMSICREASCDTAFQSPSREDSLIMGVRDEGDGAVDAAWNEAVMKPLPSTPTSAEREPGQHVPTHQDSSDNFFNQGTAFENVETVSEDSEGWESEDDCGSVLSSIASFDLDKALGELELDQQVSSKADKPSSAKSKSPSIYYSPATTFESSPPDTSSPRIAQPNDVPGMARPSLFPWGKTPQAESHALLLQSQVSGTCSVCLHVLTKSLDLHFQVSQTALSASRHWRAMELTLACCLRGCSTPLFLKQVPQIAPRKRALTAWLAIRLCWSV